MTDADVPDNKLFSIHMILIKLHALSSLLSSEVDNKSGCSLA